MSGEREREGGRWRTVRWEDVSGRPGAHPPSPPGGARLKINAAAGAAARVGPDSCARTANMDAHQVPGGGALRPAARAGSWLAEPAAREGERERRKGRRREEEEGGGGRTRGGGAARRAAARGARAARLIPRRPPERTQRHGPGVRWGVAPGSSRLPGETRSSKSTARPAQTSPSPHPQKFFGKVAAPGSVPDISRPPEGPRAGTPRGAYSRPGQGAGGSRARTPRGPVGCREGSSRDANLFRKRNQNGVSGCAKFINSAVASPPQPPLRPAGREVGEELATPAPRPPSRPPPRPPAPLARPHARSPALPLSP